ncbi:alpha/beta fold hydrolase [Gynuella sunshinyii]|uniref:Polyketide synthase modules-related protein n=1 Tax=Gynuella sunshinyii YC6258 TaxID=1445510 RepID=A0A0C5VZ22_9GAMM|nr:alpha/beta fold hydrolase [Gynuella sunshinyii]AJQ95674.1 polyketide synthase modules-related protein [Gynuella sunshinyii YC6258]
MTQDALLQEALTTINQLNQRLEKLSRQQSSKRCDIAVIGMACQLPGAASLPVFWEQLLNRYDAVGHYPAARLGLQGLGKQTSDSDIETIYGGYLDDIELFDPELFRISPREAKCMDPQQRLLLMNAHQAIIDAGIQKHPEFSRTGVFMSHYASQYLSLDGLHNPENALFMATGNASAISANRISYHYGFEGPSMVLDSACSSSLASLDVAYRYLQEGRIQFALVGAVSLNLNPAATELLQHANMLAADGKCKTFDQRADGYVPGEGAGVIVLQRVTEDLPGPARTYALIKACHVNHDGRSNGLTAPNGLAQEAVIRQTCQQANIAPETIGYVETHGTGTYLGDPVEIEALGNVVGAGRAAANPCVLGCLKTNIGHLEPAAGIASLIKASLCLYLGKIPGNNHLQTVNPLLNFNNNAFQLPSEVLDWSADERIAGVSSFGFGGLNGFALLQNAANDTEPATANALQDYPLYDFNLSPCWLDRPDNNVDPASVKTGSAFLDYQLTDTPTELFRVTLVIEQGKLEGIEDTGNFHIGFYLETIYKVFSNHFNTTEIYLDQIRFLKPLFISSQLNTEIQLLVTAQEDQVYQTDIYFKTVQPDAEWILAAQASVLPHNHVVDGDASDGNFVSRTTVSQKTFYDRYESMGMPGTGFVRAIKHCAIDETESLSGLALSFDSDRYALGAHPGFLDAVLQPAFMMLDASIKTPYMTTEMSGIRIRGPLSHQQDYQLHNRILSIVDSEASEFSVSWRIESADHHIWIDCQNTQLKRLSRTAVTHAPINNMNPAAGMTPDDLLVYIAERLEMPPEKVKCDVPLIDLGMDSLMIMSVQRILDKLQKPIDNLFNKTVNDLLNTLEASAATGENHRQTSSWPLRRSLKPFSRNKQQWVRGQQQAKKRLTLYCFPYGHLSSSVFSHWVKQMTDDIQICPIELPGHGDRINERPIESAWEIAEVLTDILAKDLQQPFALFGHSSGALIAYTWALYLQRLNKPLPQRIFVSAFSAPTINPNPVIHHAQQRYAQAGIDHLPTLNDILAPENDELVNKIIEQQHNVTREVGLSQTTPEQIATQLHAIVAIMQTVSTFDPDAITSLPVPISAFHGDRDLQVSYADMMAWQTLTNAPFTINVFPGDHLFIDAGQSEKAVMATVQEFLSLDGTRGQA